jgi:hypothetical protein
VFRVEIMGTEGLDVAVEAAKTKETKKSFKDAVNGGNNKPPDDISMEGTVQSKKIPDQPANETGTSNKPNKKLKNGCLAKMVENLRYEVTSPLVGDYIQYMKDHAVIGKFMGIWPSKKALLVWIKSRWKVKGDISLKLGSKGFFTTIFTCSEDRNRIFNEGPYFFNSKGSTSGTGRSIFPQKRRTSQLPQFGSDFTPYPRSSGT